MDIQGNIVDIDGRRIFPGTVTVQHGKITAIRERAASFRTENNLDSFRPYILPGFVDAHIHLEMTHLIPSEFAREALAQGTVAALADCHDIVHVLGIKGVECLIRDSKKVPFYFGFSAPSTTISGLYEFKDVAQLLSRKEVTHLGEVQNFPDVLLHEQYIQKLLDEAKKAGKPVDGCAPGLSKDRLDEYCVSGISSDHQCTSLDNAVEKINHGMSVILQIKKLDSLTSIFPLFKEHVASLMFSGQNMNAAAIQRGYVNEAVAKTVREGGDLFGVLRAACVTPVRHYGLQCGTLHVGDSADFIVVNNLEQFAVDATFVKGKCVYSKIPDYHAQKFKFHKMKPVNSFAAKQISIGDIQASAVSNSESKSHCCEIKPAVNCISVCDGEMTTVREVVFLKERNGCLYSDILNDCCKLVVYDRYKADAKPAVAFVQGFGFKKGALAMSVCHDAHNIIAVGVEDDDIVCAVNKVVSMRGGIAVSVENKIHAQLPFPVAGLMTDCPFEQAVKDIDAIFDTLKKEMKGTLVHPLDTLSYLTGPQLPSIKLTPDGIINVVEQEIIPLVP